MQALNFVDSIVVLWKQYETQKTKQSLVQIVNNCKVALDYGHNFEYFSKHKEKAERLLERVAA